MDACWGEYPVRMMARLLAVSCSGYYEWRGRPLSPRAVAGRRLIEEMRAIHEESDGTYGSPRMRSELPARGHTVGRHRVARLMREAHLRGSIKQRYRAPSGRRAVGAVARKVLNRDFIPSAPNHVWAGDITYVRTDEGWLYLAVVLDLYSRRVVGWSVNSTGRRNTLMMRCCDAETETETVRPGGAACDAFAAPLRAARATSLLPARLLAREPTTSSADLVSARDKSNIHYRLGNRCHPIVAPRYWSWRRSLKMRANSGLSPL